MRESDVIDELAKSEDGRVVATKGTRWVTVDGSPQGGIDWVLVGTATMKQEDLERALALAEDLAIDLPADQARETAELRAMISFQNLKINGGSFPKSKGFTFPNQRIILSKSNDFHYIFMDFLSKSKDFL